MAAPDFAPRGLCRGEGAPGGAAGGLADDAGGDQMPEQAEGGLRRDRQVFRQAARGDDRGAEQVIERPGQVRAGGAGEGGPAVSARCKPASSSRAARAAAAMQARKPASHSVPTRRERR